MKHFIILALLILSSLAVKAQNIEILKISDNQMEVKLSNGELMTVPTNGNYDIVGEKLAFENRSVLKDGKAIGRFNRSRLKLDSGDKLRVYFDGNEVEIYNKNREVVTKGKMIFDEQYNYLKNIEVTENTYADQSLTEAWLMLNIVDYLTPDDSNDDGFLLGYVIGSATGSM